MLITRPGIIAAASVSPALLRNHLGSNQATATSTTVATAPTALALGIATIVTRRTGSASSAHTCSDGVNTWTKIFDGALFSANGVRVTKWWTRYGSSPGTPTLTAGATPGTSIGAAVQEFINASSDLTNVSPAATNASGDPTATLPSNPVITSIVLASYGCISAGVPSGPAGYTEIVLLTPAGSRGQVAWAQTTTPSALWDSGATGTESALGLLEIKRA